MNKRQLAFAREYVVDGNGSAAAIRAGYSVGRARHTASELLNRPDVAAELARLGSTLAVGDGSDAGKVSREWLLAEMLDYHQRGKQGEVPAQVGERGCIRELVEIANAHGWFWGGHFSRQDAMHFELGKKVV